MDQNDFQKLWIAVLFLPFLFIDTSACSSKNITCGEIKNTDGFKFTHFCHNWSELQVESNETQLIHADFSRNTFDSSPEVVKMDNYSFTTKHCRELKVRCIIEGPNNRINETCLEVKVIEKPQPQHGRGSEAGVAAAVVVMVVIVAAIIWAYSSWIKEQNNQHGTAFVKYLVSCSCFRSVFSPQTRSGIQEVRPADLESQPNDHMETRVALSGGDENENNHNIQLESDFRVDGGPAARDQNAEDQQDSTEQPLLSDQRAAGEGFGKGGADVLVNKPGFDLDQVKGHSRARDFGVESTCKENLNN